ncbi:hypothetical protein ACFQVC_16470 [Streptomyces monticola]|uniref:Uncharacterized protein n=1 Tax=Streptomyces monticola TaxID=2666263 RepID=A0ABW2JJZ5_9ACTN
MTEPETETETEIETETKPGAETQTQTQKSRSGKQQRIHLAGVTVAASALLLAAFALLFVQPGEHDHTDHRAPMLTQVSVTKD